MTVIERYRHWYEHERAANAKMLAMIESVPVEQRGDPRFQRAVALAGHLAACRENWLDRMVAGGVHQVDWWPEGERLEGLRSRYEKVEVAWSQYLGSLTESELERDFEYGATDGRRYRWNVDGQIFQLVGHAYYHRGQIAQLVEALGGVPEDTDYLYWAFPQNPKYGPID